MNLRLVMLLSIIALLVSSPLIAAEGKHKQCQGHKGDSKYFKKVDIDSDGKISEEEWVKHHSEKFKKIDSDADSFLSDEEMRAHHESKWRKKKKHE